MDRKDINVKDKWDLSLIYKNNDEFDKDLDKSKELLDKLIGYKESFTKDKESFIDFLETYTMLDRYVSKMYSFAHLHTDVEPEVQEYQLLLSKVLSFNNQIIMGLDFMELAIIHDKENVLSYMDDDRLKTYTFFISQILKEEEHMLSQEMETLLSKVSMISGVADQVFQALRLEYEDVEFDGKKHPLSGATLNEYLKHKDQSVRQQAYEKFYKEYKKYENVYAATLSGVMKKDAFYADVRKFHDPLASSQWNDDVPEELFYKILDKANNQYRPLFHQYNALKKKVLGVETLYNYDLFTPLVENIDSKYSIEDCQKIILEVTSVFGEEYTNILKKAFSERWIDYYPNKGKRTGAYSSGCYDTKPYILMNFIGDYNSLSTMIHELGHSCHTYLSCHYQDAVNCDYRIFVAEVASTVNETLLINYMLDHASSKKEKAYYLYEFLENCVGLIFRQPMYAQFEDTLHHWAQHQEPMNASRITEYYMELNKDYYGPDVENHELVGHSCFYIPHFYYNYYVYKYTLGMTVALAIVSRILKGDKKQVEDYLSFLKSGGSMTPLELLKKANVNPLEDAIYDDAFQYFGSLLDEFEAILGEKDEA